MRTATVRDLRNKSAELLSWIEAGEEITISKRGTIVARLIPDRAPTSNKVDWTQSAAFLRKRDPADFISDEEREIILKDGQGKW